MGSNLGHKIVALDFCLNSRSVLPHGPPYGSNWGHKIADFEFLPYFSFIVAFIPSECIKRYWESVCGESK